MSARTLPCGFLLNGRPIRSETVCYETGARALTLVTTSADLRLQLYTAYVGDEELCEAMVAEVAAVSGPEPPRLRSRRIDVPRDFLLYHRADALQDHRERFIALAAESQLHVELDESAGCGGALGVAHGIADAIAGGT